MIHTIKGFSIVNEAEVDVFLEFSCCLYDPIDVGNFIFGSFDFVDHHKLWKILKRWECQITWPASWEICMQVRKQQLELDMEQQTG